MAVQESPLTTHFEYRGIQLLPGNVYPYVQTTAHPQGILLADWTVTVFSLAGKELGDISTSFAVDSVFTDDNAQPQINWSITNCDQDFGWGLVYLQITQTAGETFYTNPFQLTATDSQFSSMWHYKAEDSDTMQSIGLQTWFRSIKNKDELTTYYETQTGNTVTKELKSSRPQLWFTEYMSNALLSDFVTMLGLKYTYADLQRCNLFEAVEIPEPVAMENFAELKYQISFSGEILDPFATVSAPVVTIPSTVAMKVKAFRLASGAGYQYWLRFTFDFIADYTNIIDGITFCTFNGNTDGLDIPTLTIAGSTAVVESKKKFNSILPSAVTMTMLRINFQDPMSDPLKFVYTTSLGFSQSEMINGIEKTITAHVIEP
jgi:hypothetical protein